MHTIRPQLSPSRKKTGRYQYTLPEHLGEGSISVEAFKSGLCLYHMDLTLGNPAVIRTENPDWSFGIGFSLVGKSEARFSAQKKALSVAPGASGHFIYPGTTVISEKIHCRKTKVCVLFDSGTLEDLAADDEETFLPFIEGFRKQAFHSGQADTLPRMQQALNKLTVCPYRGKARSLYLEGLTMELLAHKLEQIRQDSNRSRKRACIKANDIDRVRHAAKRLTDAPVNPPEISTLAKEVGMSRSKFYQCFNEYFGHTPSDHLRTHRLLCAQGMLREGRHNVAETAFAVGFNNLSYFAKVFKAEFGVAPHQYR